MNYTQQQLSIIKKMSELVKISCSPDDPFIKQCLEYHGIVPLTDNYSQEELQEQAAIMKRIRDELEAFRIIPPEKEEPDFEETFDSLHNKIMYGEIESI
jgi:hypothetical protein